MKSNGTNPFLIGALDQHFWVKSYPPCHQTWRTEGVRNSPPSCKGCSPPRWRRSTLCQPKALLLPLWEGHETWVLGINQEMLKNVTDLGHSGQHNGTLPNTKLTVLITTTLEGTFTLKVRWPHHRFRCGESTGTPGRTGCQICFLAPAKHRKRDTRASQTNSHFSTWLMSNALDTPWLYRLTIPPHIRPTNFWWKC